MPDEIGLFEAIYSQRAIRKLKPDPVLDESIHKLTEAATKAPSGANRQSWKFLIIKDTELKRRIGEYYLKAWESAYGSQAARPATIQPHVRTSAEYLADHLHEAPVFIMACIEHDGSDSTLSRGSSIYPAVQNLLLAARALGLGSVLTTLHKRFESEIKDLLGIPDNVETAALLPVGYLSGEEIYGSTSRNPVKEVTYLERWGSTG